MTEKIVKTWENDGQTCVLWEHSETAYRGTVAVRGKGVAAIESLIADGPSRAEKVLQAAAGAVSEPTGIRNIEHEPVVDAVLVFEGNELRDVPRLRERVAIAHDLEFVPINHNLMRLVAKACDAPGVNRDGPSVDLRSALYALQRRPAPRDPSHTWDSDDRSKLAIALSRLVLVTSIGFGYSVRILGTLEGRYEIIPGHMRGFGAEAWPSEPETDWLSLNDMLEVREVIAAFDTSPFDIRSRLAGAMWQFEYTARTYLVDVRWPLIATAIEALLATDEDSSTRNFVHRVPALARALGIDDVGRGEASRMGASEAGSFMAVSIRMTSRSIGLWRISSARR